MNYYNNPYGYPQQQQYYQQVPQQQQFYTPAQTATPAPEPIEDTGSLGFSFTIVPDAKPNAALVVGDKPNDTESDSDGKPKRKRGRPRKVEVESGEIVRGDKPLEGEVLPTMYTYQETTNMLRGTLAQIDELAGQVKNELNAVIGSRTLKSKYQTMVGLSENLGDILSTKISAIKEINNAISKSNEMDYKREKDRKAAEAGVNDDKYLMDMYTAFVQNPGGNAPISLGPTGIDATLGGDGIIRASSQPQPQGFAPDNSYLQYVTNMTPEQKLMSLEDNPNIKLAVIYDAATGNKAFQWMDMSTGQTVPGLPQRDPMFLEDTTINIKDKVAKNINLNETYPVVIINENVVNEY